MDWSKAKTILIVALLITNGLLGSVLFLDRNHADATTGDEFVLNSINLLKEKNIDINGEIPIDTEDLYGLTVEYEGQNVTDLNYRFFRGEGKVELDSEGLFTLSNGDETLSIINDKLIMYESNPVEEKYNIVSNEMAEAIAKDFLIEKGFSTTDLELSFIKENNGEYNLEFTKVFDGSYVESTFTNIQLDNRGVLKLERNWLNMKDIGATKIQISSAPKSILALLSMKEVYGKTIKDISLCYYFDPQKHSDTLNPQEAKQGTTTPAWRIQFEDGYKVIIDNY